MRWTNCIRFTKIRPKMKTLSHKPEKDLQADGQTDGRQKPRHKISCAGFQLVELKKKSLVVVLVHHRLH